MNQENSQNNLLRGLNLIDAFCIVAGGVIGTGVFIKTAAMTQAVGSPGYVMLAWIIAGLLSLSGALVYGEIGSLYPHAGGEYIYLRESFGGLTSYLYGWTRILIASPASLAAYAVGGASFLSGAMNLDMLGGVPGTAIMFIVFFSVINSFKVTVGGKLQTLMTLLKVVLIIGLAALLFFSGKGNVANFSSVSPDHKGWPGFSAFGIAMLAALWAYDGWNNLPMIAGEVKNPERNVPRAFMLGMFTVIVIYCLANLAYFYMLPHAEIINGYSDMNPNALPVATKAAEIVLGSTGVKIMSIMFVISALGALTGATMSFARVPFAMAQDGVFFKKLGTIHPKTHVPVISIVVQCVVSCLFAASGKFDQLTNYVVFSSWIFYALVTASIFKFRKKHPNHEGYKVWGYPWMPIVFIVVATFLLINTIYVAPKDTMIGLFIIAAGVPFYFMFKRSQKA